MAPRGNYDIPTYGLLTTSTFAAISVCGLDYTITFVFTLRYLHYSLYTSPFLDLARYCHFKGFTEFRRFSVDYF